jgi:beta-glucosidase
VSKPTSSDASFTSKVSVTITNSGPLTGSEIVQVYISPAVVAPIPSPTTGYIHPRLQLKGFFKVKDLAPGASETVEIALDKLSVSYWNDVFDKWVVEKGEYKVWVGKSSEDLTLVKSLVIDETFEWTGL